MKKQLFGFLILFVVATSCFAQEDYQEGILFLGTGDSINCMIDVYDTDIFIYSEKIKYLIDDKKIKIKSSEVSSIRFGNLVYEKIIFERKRQVHKGPRKVWVKYNKIFYAALIKNGPAKFYNHYYLQSGSDGTGAYLVTSHYVRTADKLKMITKLGFKEDCIDLFQDCSEAISKIEAKEYRYRTIENLIDFVNDECF